MRTIFHIDFNSYFARVEQQKNPFLRCKPVGVLKAAGRTVVIAASVEAKRLGVKTGSSVLEARRLAPTIVLVPADFDSYYDTTKRFTSIASRYSDRVELFSLDEVFLDVTDTAPILGGAISIAQAIKHDLRTELGEWLTVSIGIAKNKFLAKLASDMEKPDGLVEITDKNQDYYLGRATFDQVCGIGWRLEKRLGAMGITQLLQIRSVSEKFLLASFGPYWTKRLIDLSWGRDETLLATDKLATPPKSVSRTHTLFVDLIDERKILGVIRNLVEEATAKLRAARMAGRQFGLMIRGDEQSDAFFVTRKHCSNDPAEAFHELKRLYLHGWFGSRVRFLGVWVSLLEETDRLTAPLFFDIQRRQQLLLVQDQVNQKFGHYTVFPASLLWSPIIRPEVNGYLGDERIKQRIIRNSSISSQ